MRKEALEITPDHLLRNNSLSNENDIWDVEYKSTSDEEDNDTDEEEYPKVNSRIKTAEEQKIATEKSIETLKEDVVMKIMNKDKALLRRDLSARLKRIHMLQANLKRMRKLSDLEEDEISDLDKSEDYSWWKGPDDNRGIFFAMGTKFSSSYNKGDQLFNCYGRRTNRFLLVNYGFVLRYNKYNCLGFRVYVTFKDEDSENKEPQKHQKIIKLRMHRLSLDLLQYLRANLIPSYPFKNKDRETVTASTPVHIDFEIFTMTQAVSLLESMIANQFPTTLKQDLETL